MGTDGGGVVFDLQCAHRFKQSFGDLLCAVEVDARQQQGDSYGDFIFSESLIR
jgi:hypothetical protein